MKDTTSTTMILHMISALLAVGSSPAMVHSFGVSSSPVRMRICDDVKVPTTRRLLQRSSEMYGAKQLIHIDGDGDDDTNLAAAIPVEAKAKAEAETEAEAQAGQGVMRDVSRRSFAHNIAASSFFLLLSTSSTTPSVADAAQTAGEAVRRSAANIPGYGQPDVFYPSSFVGKWRATRVIVSSDGTSSDASTSIRIPVVPLTIFYDVRFITVDGDDGGGSNNSAKKEGGKVIADRQFNEASYYNALKAAIEAQQSQAQSQSQSAATLPTIQTVSWSPFNPNVCTTTYSDSSTKEIKVTKRAAELDEGAGIISSSEYRRITTASGAMGIPSISASRVLTKWKWDSSYNNSNGGSSGKQIVEGIEVVYSDGAMGGDPMTMGIGGGTGAGAGGKPQVSSKSRLRLERRD